MIVSTGAMPEERLEAEPEQQQLLKDTVVTVSDKVKDDLRSDGTLFDVLSDFNFALQQIESVQEEPEFTCDVGSVLRNNTCGTFVTSSVSSAIA